MLASWWFSGGQQPGDPDNANLQSQSARQSKNNGAGRNTTWIGRAVIVVPFALTQAPAHPIPAPRAPRPLSIARVVTDLHIPHALSAAVEAHVPVFVMLYRHS